MIKLQGSLQNTTNYATLQVNAPGTTINEGGVPTGFANYGGSNSKINDIIGMNKNDITNTHVNGNLNTGIQVIIFQNNRIMISSGIIP